MTTPNIYSFGRDATVSPEVAMLRLASGHVAARAIHVFAALGIPDLLMEGAASAEHLAARVSVDARVLFRVLRFLSTIDVVSVTDNGFQLTRLGRTLCSKPTRVILENTLLMGSDHYWAAIGALPRVTASGQGGYEPIVGQHLFDFLANRPGDAAIFNAAMSSSSRIAVGSILAAYDFSVFGTIVDVGGGQGEFLRAIVSKNSSVRGVVHDLPRVVEDAPPLDGRLTFVGGDLFGQVPSGGDAYILRRVLHDWGDDDALRILRGCRAAMSARSVLLVIELAAPIRESESGNNWAAQDLLMLLTLNARERSIEDFDRLFAAAGFVRRGVVTTNSPYWIVEAVVV